jgi:hypothetical protein
MVSEIQEVKESKKPLKGSTHFQQYFSYIMVTSFSGGRSRSTMREPPTLGKQLVNFYDLRLRVECTLFVIYKAGRELLSDNC